MIAGRNVSFGLVSARLNIYTRLKYKTVCVLSTLAIARLYKQGDIHLLGSPINIVSSHNLGVATMPHKPRLEGDSKRNVPPSSWGAIIKPPKRMMSIRKLKLKLRIPGISGLGFAGSPSLTPDHEPLT